MSNLIPVFQGNINQDQTQLVDARLLHEFLEVDTHFNDWISRRISEYEFAENIDFITITQKRVIGHGRGKKDYHITLDMAKELSMIERTEKGRQARKYFIECEKKLLSAYREPETITVSKQNLTSLINDVLWLRQIFIESKLLESLRSIGADKLSDTLNSRMGNAMIGVKLLNYNNILFSQANPR